MFVGQGVIDIFGDKGGVYKIIQCVKYLKECISYFNGFVLIKLQLIDA